ADGREAHCPAMRRSLPDGMSEVRHGALAHRLLGREMGDRTERPHASSPTVLDAAPAVPATAGRASVANASGHALGLDEEPKTRSRECVELPPDARLANDGDQQTRHVVGAVPLLASWDAQ